MRQYDVTLREAYSLEGRGEAAAEKTRPGFARFQFFELCLRLAKYLFATRKDEKEGNEIVGKLSDHVTVTQAFRMFVDTVLKDYKEGLNINWQRFRDDKLSDEDVELVFTMNLSFVDRIYSKYAKLNLDTATKPHDADYLAFVDCEQLLRFDSKLQLRRRVIKEAFSMCKGTVANELDPEGMREYNKLSKVEFLEFLARISELIFIESEMDDLALYEKIEFVLDDILPLVGAKRVK